MAASITSLLRSYFELGLTYRDIVSAMKFRDNVSVSERHVKRLLRSYQLKRRVFEKDVDVRPVAEFIEEQLKGSGRLHGYRWMHSKCRLAGFSVTREIVRQICKQLDPVGVELRKKRRLNRRSYYAKGPNYVWHVDGYDKLKPFGICISGCIDGFSRRIVWLKASTTNNDPAVICGFFLNAVNIAEGCPRIVRGDFGTENAWIRDCQRILRQNGDDERAGFRSYIDGASTANQRIESWWGILRKESAEYWITLFSSLKDEGAFDGSFLDKSVLQFCFMGKMQDELDQVSSVWNSHRIRSSKTNSFVPYGIPNTLYLVPELSGSRNYLHHLHQTEINRCLAACASDNDHVIPCDIDVFEMCCRIMNDKQLQYLNETWDLVKLYYKLRTNLHEIMHSD